MKRIFLMLSFFGATLGLQGCKLDGIQVSASPGGTVVSDTEINCSSDGTQTNGLCSGAKNTAHTLSAQANPGYRFLSFVGADCSLNEETCVIITQGETLQVMAIFVPTYSGNAGMQVDYATYYISENETGAELEVNPNDDARFVGHYSHCFGDRLKYTCSYNQQDKFQQGFLFERSYYQYNWVVDSALNVTISDTCIGERLDGYCSDRAGVDGEFDYVQQQTEPYVPDSPRSDISQGGLAWAMNLVSPSHLARVSAAVFLLPIDSITVQTHIKLNMSTGFDYLLDPTVYGIYMGLSDGTITTADANTDELILIATQSDNSNYVFDISEHLDALEIANGETYLKVVVRYISGGSGMAGTGFRGAYMYNPSE